MPKARFISFTIQGFLQAQEVREDFLKFATVMTSQGSDTETAQFFFFWGGGRKNEDSEMCEQFFFGGGGGGGG